MKECIEDLCEYCPEPKNDEEKKLQEEEDKVYIRGRISFIEDDPGRQSMNGSFNPIDIGEWSELTYLGPTEKFFAAIAAKDRNTVQQLLASGEVDINRRDHVGRTALQLATLCAAGEFSTSGRASLFHPALSDPSAVAALNVPFTPQKFIYPLVSAIAKSYYSVAALLLGYGARVDVTAEDVQKAKNLLPNRNGWYYGSNKTPHELDYMREVYLPIETALAHQNYMSTLLLKLGAQASVPIKAYFDRGNYSSDVRVSLLDCVVRQIMMLEDDLNKLEKEQPTQKYQSTEDPKTFVETRKAMQEKLEQIKKDNEETKDPNAPLVFGRQNSQKGEEQRRISNLRKGLSFFQEMKNLLADAPRAAEPLKPVAGVEDKQTKRTQYRFFSQHRWNREDVLPQLLDQYDALFEACWLGNNTRIEELCLPRTTSKSDKPPLRITVETQEDNAGGAYTPLSVAILARKWDTARVILAISKAQYKTEEDGHNKGLAMNSIVFDVDEDSDDGSTIRDSDDDMDIDDDGPGHITDLANRDSAVQCDISPKFFMDRSISSRVRKDGQAIIPVGTIASQACHDGDLEAFVNICDLMQQLPEPHEPDMQCLIGEISSDTPELVDEVIRRTGLGIDLNQLVVSENDTRPVSNSSKFYLGLTVHGKKRKDLARYIEGHKSNATEKSLPLLWSAISSNSKKVVEYLSGSGPLAAYRYYAETISTERAEALRRLDDLDKQLPKLVGILPNSRGETALTTVILSAPEKERLSLAKHLLSLFPAQRMIQSSIAFTGWTPLHLAAAENLEPSFFNFLLANGLYAEQTDSKGMNIYHFVCRFGHADLLRYFLEELLRDVSSQLLKQATREIGETPLMTAVSNGEWKVVELLLQSGLEAVKECLSMRDAKGSLPLHSAVHSGFAKIASLLIEAESDSDAIYSENGVGETPLETAYAKFLIYATRENYPGDSLMRYRGLITLDSCRTMTPPSPREGHYLSTEVELLKEAHANLLRDDKLAANPKLRDALEAFIPYLTEKANGEADSAAASEKEETKDQCNREKTFKVISAAISADKARRYLVHLTDVQRSVRASLEKANRKTEAFIDYEYSRKHRFLKGAVIPDEDEAQAKKHEMWTGILAKSWRLRELVN